MFLKVLLKRPFVLGKYHKTRPNFIYWIKRIANTGGKWLGLWRITLTIKVKADIVRVKVISFESTIGTKTDKHGSQIKMQRNLLLCYCIIYNILSPKNWFAYGTVYNHFRKIDYLTRQRPQKVITDICHIQYFIKTFFKLWQSIYM